MKDAYYFPHDSNAKDDPKMVMLIEQLGLEGYGIFWALVETLRDQPGYKYPLKLVPALARRYNTTAEKMKAVIMSYELFEVEDEKFFYSNSLRQRMLHYDEKREKARKAAQIRWQNKISSGKQTQCDSNADALQMQSAPNASKVKYSKVKYSKIKDSKNFENLNLNDMWLNTDENLDHITTNNEQVLSDRGNVMYHRMLKNNKTVIRANANAYELTEYQVEKQLKKFIRLQVANSEIRRDYNKIKKHFGNWLGKQNNGGN